MNYFSKKDIETLDYMVECLIKNGEVTLFDFGNTFVSEKIKNEGLEFKIQDITENEYLEYLQILKEFDVCEVNLTEDSESTKKTPSTLLFRKKGGFQALNQKLKEQEKREKLNDKKTKVDLKLAEETLKEFPRTKWFARIAFGISIILIIKEIINFFSK